MSIINFCGSILIVIVMRIKKFVFLRLIFKVITTCAFGIVGLWVWGMGFLFGVVFYYDCFWVDLWFSLTIFIFQLPIIFIIRVLLFRLCMVTISIAMPIRPALIQMIIQVNTIVISTLRFPLSLSLTFPFPQRSIHQNLIKFTPILFCFSFDLFLDKDMRSVHFSRLFCGTGHP